MTWINKNIKDLDKIEDFDYLLEEFNKMLNPSAIEYKGEQLSLQKPKDWDEEKYGKEEWCSVGKPSNFPDKYKSDEELFNETISIIKGTYIEELINKYKLFKTRCAILQPKKCYTWHFDNWTKDSFYYTIKSKMLLYFWRTKKRIP